MVQCYKKFISGPPADGSQRVNECFFNIHWEEMFSNIDINTVLNKFITIVEDVIDKMVPTKIVKERNYPKWMTK